MSKWISVKDKRPPKGMSEILIYVAPKVNERSYASLRGMIVVNNGVIYGSRNVTHWMPLPEPPEDV